MNDAVPGPQQAPAAAGPPAATAPVSAPAPHSAAPPESAQLSHASIRAIMVGILLAMFLSALEQTIVAPALPTIGRTLGDVENLSWVVTAYLLANTAATPLFGKLSDIHGRRRMMLVAMVIFIAGSVACITVSPCRRVRAKVDKTRRGRPRCNPTGRVATAKCPLKWLAATSGSCAQDPGVASDQHFSVELRGFEPLTPCMPCRCATSCATAPRPPEGNHLRP